MDQPRSHPEFLVGLGPAADDWTRLPGEEQTYVECAGRTRRNEFAAGRQLARRLLHGLGHTAPVLPQDTAGRVTWPVGIVGSISHSRSVCLVVVARATAVRSVGVDIEEVRPVEPDLWPWLLSERERSERVSADAVLARFSAKEAAYKCASPWLATAFDPRQVDVALHAGGRFTATIAGAPLPWSRLTGWTVRTDRWIAAVAVVPQTA